MSKGQHANQQMQKESQSISMNHSQQNQWRHDKPAQNPRNHGPKDPMDKPSKQFSPKKSAPKNDQPAIKEL